MNSILKRLEQLYSINDVPSKLLHDGDMLVIFPLLILDGKPTRIQIGILSSMHPNVYRFKAYGIGKYDNFSVLDKIKRFNTKHYDEMQIGIDDNNDYYLQQDIMFKLNPSVDDVFECVADVSRFIQNNLREIKDIVGKLE